MRSRLTNSGNVGFLFALFVCALVLPSVTTFAIQEEAISSKGLTISPLRSEIGLAPGNSLDGSLIVGNETKKPIKVTMNTEEFRVINEQYDYAFSDDSDVTKWIIFKDNELKLKPGERKRVNYSIAVPLKAEPGGRYISLFASTDSGSGAIRSRQRVASLLYVTVLGDVVRTGKLVRLNAPWLLTGTSEWSGALQNSGTTHFRSRYSAGIYDIFGREVAPQTNEDALVLPGTVRSVAGKISEPSWPGIYKTGYTIGLGDTPAITTTRIVLFVPSLKTLGLLATVLFVVALSIFYKRRRTR